MSVYLVGNQYSGHFINRISNPVLSRDNVNWVGTGQGDLVFNENGSPYLDKDGNIVYIFHTHVSKENTQKVPRETAIAKMRLKSDGSEPDIREIVAD